MASEMDQFYRSTIAIYKVSAGIDQAQARAAPATARRSAQLWKTESMAAACSGTKGWEAGWSGLWAWGWGSRGIGHPSPNLRLPGWEFVQSPPVTGLPRRHSAPAPTPTLRVRQDKAPGGYHWAQGSHTATWPTSGEFLSLHPWVSVCLSVSLSLWLRLSFLTQTSYFTPWGLLHLLGISCVQDPFTCKPQDTPPVRQKIITPLDRWKN